MGCASRAEPVSISANMALRRACARPIDTPAASALRISWKATVVNSTAAPELTGQCETSRARAPA